MRVSLQRPANDTDTVIDWTNATNGVIVTIERGAIMQHRSVHTVLVTAKQLVHASLASSVHSINRQLSPCNVFVLLVGWARTRRSVETLRCAPYCVRIACQLLYCTVCIRPHRPAGQRVELLDNNMTFIRPTRAQDRVTVTCCYTNSSSTSYHIITVK